MKSVYKDSYCRKSGRALRVLKIAAIVLLSLLLLLNISAAVISGIGVSRSLNILPGTFVTIETGSMSPKINEGDLVFDWHTPYEKLKVGDVITFTAGNDFVTHEIVEIFDGDLVTQGSQNEIADDPIGEQDYCAKVILVIPHGAAAMKLLTKAWFTVLLVVLILLVCYGVPLFSWIYDKFTHAVHERGVGAVRVMISLVLVSAILVTPLLSLAKYRSEIGGIVASSAESVYFKSNYLSEEGNDYHVSGWEGVGSDINVEIRNWENKLLYNEKADVKYTVKLEQLERDARYEVAEFVTGQTFYTKDGDTYTVYNGKTGDVHPSPLYKLAQKPYQTDYTLTASIGANTLIDSDGDGVLDSYTYVDVESGETVTTSLTLLHGMMPDDEGKEKLRSDVVTVHLNSTRKDPATGKQVPFNPGEVVSYRITAETVTDDDSGASKYHQVLTGVFSFEVATQSSFLGEGTFNQKKDSGLVEYTLHTNRVSETAFRKVVFRWTYKSYTKDAETNATTSSTVLDINTRKSPIWDYLKSGIKIEDEETVIDPLHWNADKSLTLTLEAPSILMIQFFNKTSQKCSAEVYTDLEGAGGEKYDEIHFILEDWESPTE